VKHRFNVSERAFNNACLDLQSMRYTNQNDAVTR
jgi:hypothetical protein